MKLNEEQKAFLVRCWARYMAPLKIQQAFKEHYGVPIDDRQVHSYNPEGSRARSTKNGKGLDRWKPLFNEAREQFLKDVDSIPIAHAGYRLRELGDLYIKMRDKNATKIALDILEQAAKEAGGVFTNKTELRANLKVKQEEPAMSVDEQVAVVMAALEDALKKGGGAASATKH